MSQADIVYNQARTVAFRGGRYAGHVVIEFSRRCGRRARCINFLSVNKQRARIDR